ncbi:MAG: hypothetical protein M3P18_07495 [Actinomycetota bacterium]|nr:hypothetical protein [Actinomycetota bacterium]
MDDPSASLAEALAAVLGPTERVEITLAAVGCTLFLTDRKLVLVRDGANYRPRTGIRSWPRDPDLMAQLAKGERDTMRLVIGSGPSVSIFLPAGQGDAARALVAAIRQPRRVDD